jgi:pantothenate kinase
MKWSVLLLVSPESTFMHKKKKRIKFRLGLNFFITEIPFEVFTYNEQETDPMRFEEKTKDIYPYMVFVQKKNFCTRY